MEPQIVRPTINDLTSIKVTFDRGNVNNNSFGAKKIYREPNVTSPPHADQMEVDSELPLDSFVVAAVDDLIGTTAHEPVVNEEDNSWFAHLFIDSDEPEPPAQAKEPVRRHPHKIPSFMLPKKVEEDTSRQNRLGVETIFPNACFQFMNEGCVEGERCFELHEYPTNDFVHEQLVKIGPELAAKLFHVVIRRNFNLLERYFCTFVDFFAAHGQQDELISTIEVLKHPKLARNNRLTTHFVELFTAFTNCGCSNGTAIGIIIINLRNPTQVVVDSLINFNLRNLVSDDDFALVLKELMKNKYKFNAFMVNRIMSYSLQKANCNLIKMSCKLGQKFQGKGLDPATVKMLIKQYEHLIMNQYLR